ncbi:hypothetical protein ACLIL2_006205 [Acinetobacter radioresistens]|uniref:phage tail terminator protein n=1 Tax=Acinetobacter radioresistens TaxID=40216 RepID=UPI003984D089
MLTPSEGILAVNTPFSVDDMLQITNIAPALNVIYVGDRVGDNVGQGRSNMVTQQWLIVLTVRDASSQLNQTSNIRKEADPLIRELLSKMQGFNPQIAGFRSFERVDAGVQIGSSSGFAYFPFLFEIKFTN